MKLQVDCTWNEGKEKGKVTVAFENTPKSLFSMNDHELINLKNLEKNCLLEGPNALKELKNISEENSKSLYAQTAYFQALRAFEFFDDAHLFFQTIKKKFPEELITRCIEGNYFLEENKLEEFKNIFSNQEVLKAAFPNRKIFYYQEAIFFHNAWGLYHAAKKDVFQAEKHEKFMSLIIHTYHTIGIFPTSNVAL